MNSSFGLINSLVDFLGPLNVAWFVSGGWAIDIHLNQITRKRCDLDISVPFSDRLKCIEFFLEAGWRIEGKLGDSFRTLRKISDYTDDIHYFWSFPEGVDFVSEYVDDNSNRRIAYNRDSQTELDYIEAFFDMIEDGYFIFRRDPRVKRREERAILEKDRVRYLAPELVLLFKSNRRSEKNLLDFDAIVDSLGEEALIWLTRALSLVYENSHTWLKQLEEKIGHEKTCRLGRAVGTKGLPNTT
jgi:hypothetical protein